jgi:hypothetical protein
VPLTPQTRTRRVVRPHLTRGGTAPERRHYQTSSTSLSGSNGLGGGLDERFFADWDASHLDPWSPRTPSPPLAPRPLHRTAPWTSDGAAPTGRPHVVRTLDFGLPVSPPPASYHPQAELLAGGTLRQTSTDLGTEGTFVAPEPLLQPLLPRSRSLRTKPIIASRVGTRATGSPPWSPQDQNELIDSTASALGPGSAGSPTRARRRARAPSPPPVARWNDVESAGKGARPHTTSLVELHSPRTTAARAGASTRGGAPSRSQRGRGRKSVAWTSGAGAAAQSRSQGDARRELFPSFEHLMLV